MDVAISRVEVGIRDLKNKLSVYVDIARNGGEVVVTDRGRPGAKLTALHRSEDRVAALVAAGIVTPPRSRRRSAPVQRVVAEGTVSDLIADQRR